MNRLSRRWFLIAFFINLTCFASHPLSQAIDQEIGLDGQIERLRQSFSSVYYQMVERGLFPLTYNNNLIINSQIQINPQRDGTIILKLVEWLEKQEDRESLFLLKKVNKLFYLEFHKLIFSIKGNRKDQAALLEACQELYQWNTTINGYVEKPFRTILSKLYLLMAIVNGSEFSYENKKQTLAYVLDKVKKEILLINSRIKSTSVCTKTIKKFVTLLEVVGVEEPLVKPNILRRAVIIGIIAIVIGVFVWKVVIPKWDSKIAPVLDDFGKKTRKFLIAPWIEEVVDQLVKKAPEIGRGVLHGAANDEDENPNPDVAKLANRIVHGAVIKQPGQPAVGETNPDLTNGAEGLRNRLAQNAGPMGKLLVGQPVPPKSPAT